MIREIADLELRTMLPVVALAAESPRSDKPWNLQNPSSILTLVFFNISWPFGGGDCGHSSFALRSSLSSAFHALDHPSSWFSHPQDARCTATIESRANEERAKESDPLIIPLLLYRGLLESMQVSVETTGFHQIVVGAHLGDAAPIDHADHVGVPYSGQTVGYGDTRSALHSLV